MKMWGVTEHHRRRSNAENKLLAKAHDHRKGRKWQKGEERTRLTVEDQAAIVTAIEAGARPVDLARKYCVSKSTITCASRPFATGRTR